jgi:hypothetical protein
MNSNISGAPHTLTNPFTGAASLNPIRQFTHTMGGNAVIGGYMYHGQISALQDKYFYSDFVSTGQIWMLEFDRNTPTASYNGSNGANTDVTALWQSLVYDATDPSYMPDSTTGNSAGLDHIVSFGEDNAGNLYLVDFGNGSGFSGQYPGAGRGEIFRIVPNLLDGDYNDDGTVDAADYVVWRKNDGTQAGFDLWRAHFGEAAGGGSGASTNATVPEPATMVMLIVTAAGVSTRRRWRTSRVSKLINA